MERDNYQHQLKNYNHGLTNLGVENLTDQAEQVPDLSRRPNITAEEFAEHKSAAQITEIEKTKPPEITDPISRFLKEENRELKINQTRVENDFTKYKEEYKFKEIDIRKAVNEATENKEKEINELTGELNKLNDNLLSLKARDKLEIAHLKTESKSYKNRKEKVAQDLAVVNLLDTLRDKLTKLEKELKEKQTNLTKFQNQDYQGQISRLENQLLNTTKTKEQQAVKISEQEEKLAEVNQQLQQQITDNEQREKDYRDLATKLEQAQQSHTQSEKIHRSESNQDDLVKVVIGGAMILMKLATEKEKNRELKIEREGFKNERDSTREAKHQLYQKLKAIKKNQKSLAQQTKTELKNSCWELIKYQNVTNNFETDNTLEQALTGTVNSFVNTIAAAQTHLKITDLTKLTTDHTLPKGKGLGDLITFYHANQDKAPVPPQPLKSTVPNQALLMNQIIQECELGLNHHSTVIKQLELASLTKLFGAVVDSTTQQQIQAATNYSQVVQVRQAFLAKHLTSQPDSTLTPLNKPNSI
ncbi:20054_t:CDS:2 [Funneliformis geosporum]|nr:20054_t:CDS:2 [Funneliformis geosporum]